MTKPVKLSKDDQHAQKRNPNGMWTSRGHAKQAMVREALEFVKVAKEIKAEVKSRKLGQ
jgi:hypothetical protein